MESVSNAITWHQVNFKLSTFLIYATRDFESITEKLFLFKERRNRRIWISGRYFLLITAS